MSLQLRKLHGRWFLGSFYGHITTKSYFHCIEPSCPFSVKVRFSFVDGQKTPTVERIVFGQHCHAFKSKSKAETRKIVEREKASIDSGNDVVGVLAAKHEKWQDEAQKRGSYFGRSSTKTTRPLNTPAKGLISPIGWLNKTLGRRCRGMQSTWPVSVNRKNLEM